MPFAYQASHIPWIVLGDLYHCVFFGTQTKGDRQDMNVLGDLLDWNEALISSFYDRALHPIGQTLKFAVRSRDLIILGFPSTTIPGPDDLGQPEHINKPPRVNPRIPVFSKRTGYTNLPVGPGQCAYGKAELPEPDPPIDTTARASMPWERLYEHPRHHFIELLGMLLVISGQAHYHSRSSLD